MKSVMTRAQVEKEARELERFGKMWNLKNLYDSCSTCQTQINDKQVPARPVNWKYRTLAHRIKEAWAVFIGKAEAFTWPEGQ